MTTSLVAIRRRNLAAHLAALLLLSPPCAFAATTWTVNTCDEGNFGNPGAHTGTLRFAAATASTGDTIDLSQLTCSVITLKSGAIALTQDDITLNGPGMDALTITGKYAPGNIEHDRIIRHSGTGWLKISALSVAYGFLDENSYDRDGGCIKSEGNTTLNHVSAKHCRTYGSNGDGGAIATQGALWLLNSTISNNVAGVYGANTITEGGGAYVIGDLVAINSTISNNVARAEGDAGGILVRGNAWISYSTISNNGAINNGGGMVARANVVIGNSTLSGNHSSYGSGALSAEGNVSILNSTITLNTGHWIGGIELRPYQPMAVTLQSSLIASNTYVHNGAVHENDLDRCCAAAQATVTFSGTHNIVRTPWIALPPGIATTGVCPLLGALRDNSGPTFTHALLSTSPGIDEGSAGTFTYDQRGFARTSGLDTDAGAYEIDRADVLFNNSFDGCP